jgi:hypothetical protein
MIADIKAETLELQRTIMCNNSANRCEDCPVTNPDPPSESDCPNFELLGSIPICTKEDATRRQIDHGRGSTGIGNTALKSIE